MPLYPEWQRTRVKPSRGLWYYLRYTMVECKRARPSIGSCISTRTKESRQGDSSLSYKFLHRLVNAGLPSQEKLCDQWDS
jgi:hypothetical protein